MRAVFLVLCLIAATLLAGWALFLVGRAAVRAQRGHDEQQWAKAAEDAEWESRSYGDTAGDMRVSVARVARRDGRTRVVDEHPVARISAEAPDWDDQFRRACDTARARAFELNLARSAP